MEPRLRARLDRLFYHRRRQTSITVNTSERDVDTIHLVVAPPRAQSSFFLPTFWPFLAEQRRSPPPQVTMKMRVVSVATRKKQHQTDLKKGCYFGASVIFLLPVGARKKERRRGREREKKRLRQRSLWHASGLLVAQRPSICLLFLSKLGPKKQGTNRADRFFFGGQGFRFPFFAPPFSRGEAQPPDPQRSPQNKKSQKVNASSQKRLRPVVWSV